jgi:hypothetical protein
MNNIYQKNVFFQKSKEKYNPDVLKKKELEDKNRNSTIFKKSNITYNSITNQNPENIKSQHDLELKKDTCKLNLEQIILQKKKERDEQDLVNKPIKQKVLANGIIDNSTNNIDNGTNNIDNGTNNIQNFNELKNEQTDYIIQQQKIIETNKNKYENIMKNLKELGILNN